MALVPVTLFSLFAEASSHVGSHQPHTLSLMVGRAQESWGAFL